MKDQEERKQQLQNARERFAQLGERTLPEIAHEVGIKGLVVSTNLHEGHLISYSP